MTTWCAQALCPAPIAAVPLSSRSPSVVMFSWTWASTISTWIVRSCRLMWQPLRWCGLVTHAQQPPRPWWGLWTCWFPPVKQVDIMMNDVLLVTSGDTCPFRVYLTTLFSYRSMSKEGCSAHLKAGPWMRQPSTVTRRMRAWSSGGLLSPAFRGRLHSDVLSQDGLADVRLVLSCTQLGFHLMDYGSKPKCHAHITVVVLEVCIIKVGVGVVVFLEDSQQAKYLYSDGQHHWKWYSNARWSWATRTLNTAR